MEFYEPDNLQRCMQFSDVEIDTQPADKVIIEWIDCAILVLFTDRTRGLPPVLQVSIIR